MCTKQIYEVRNENGKLWSEYEDYEEANDEWKGGEE